MTDSTPRIFGDITNLAPQNGTVSACEPSQPNARTPAALEGCSWQEGTHDSQAQDSSSQGQSVAALFQLLYDRLEADRREGRIADAALLGQAFEDVAASGQLPPGSGAIARLRAIIARYNELREQLQGDLGFDEHDDNRTEDDIGAHSPPPNNNHGLGAIGSWASAPEGLNPSDSDSDGPPTPGDSEQEDFATTIITMEDVRDILSMDPAGRIDEEDL